MKRVHHILAVGFLAAIATTSAQAALESGGPHYFLQTGADLEKSCANPSNLKEITPAERERLLICGAYIQGFLGHYSLVRKELSAAPFCLPSGGVSAEKVRVLFLALLQQKPQIRDLPASVDLATGLAWGYSCTHTATDKATDSKKPAQVQPDTH